MADTVERTIYKLEIDDAAYIKGIDSLSASTKKLSDEQARANATLKTNEAALKANSEFLQKAKKDLDDYTGTNERYRKQLEKSFTGAQADQIKLTKLVADNKAAYDAATKSAQDFANIAARASQLQQQTTGGKIPVAPPPGIQSPVTNFTGFGDVIPQTKAEFDQLAIAIATAEAHLETLDAESQEFKTIKPIVDQAKVALQQYGDATQEAGGKTQSIRAQLRAAKEELVKLEQAGKGATAQYFELEKRTAKLTDQFNDQQQRIKILASDTKLLDFGKGAITAATSAFQTYAAVSILTGDESAELQKKTMQLFAAMQLLQSLEQLSNLTRREGVLATLAQSGAQSVYTAVIGASTGALKAFRIALALSGLGAAVIAIGFLVNKYQQLAAAAREAERESKLLSEINTEVAKSAGTEIAALEILYKVATNGNVPIKERKKAVDELQKQYPDYFKNINDEIILQGKAAEAYDATKLAILESAKTRAIESKLAQLASDELEKAQEKENVLRKVEKNRLDQQKADRRDSRDAEVRGLDQFFTNVKKNDLQGELSDINKDLADISKDRDFLLNQITTAGTTTTDTKPGAGTREIENEFARKKAELDARLAALTRQEADNESKIRIEFAARLAKEQLEIEKLQKEKKITAPQAEILKAENIQINTLELDKALADFRKKITDARNKLNDELRDLQTKANQDTLNLIQDDFTRRAALIDFNEKEELMASQEATDDRLASLELDRLLIGEQAYQDAKAIIIATGEQNALNIIARAAQARQDLAVDSFKKTLDAFQAGLNEGLVARDEELAKQIRAASDRFLQGKTTFEQFQKDLTKIQRDEEGIRRDITLANQRGELASLDAQIKATKDKTTAGYKELLRLRQELQKDIAAGEKDDAVKDAEDANADPKSDTPLSVVAEYTAAVAQLSDSIVSFWQKANEAERQALDKSIILQQKRVDAAQRIAERGNAQYLKQEEDKLKDLEVKRENAARKQMGIDAALQASQVLVGITGAISHIGTGTAAQTIAEIAVIIGALATGYSIVKSLQGNQPQLAEGTTYMKRGRNPAGRDTIPAWLNEGEAVIPTGKNKAYHPTVKAIYDGTIPAEHLNKFVTNYHKIKSVPQPNYQRIKEAAEIHVSSDGKMAVLLTEQNRLLVENNELSRQILKKNVHVENKIDRDGVSTMVHEYILQREIDKKV